MLTAGPHMVMCPVENVIATMSFRVRQLDVDVLTKTLDNVTVTVYVAVQYCVHNPEEEFESKERTANQPGSPLYDAYYALQDVNAQISNYVENVVRASVPRMELDDLFASKNTLNEAICSQLGERMKGFGYEIKQTLVVNLQPDIRVANAMNEINAQSRLREAANYQADANKIQMVKAAEAEAQSKYLSGLGVARQRKAIVEGLQTTVSDFSSTVKGSSSSDVMDVLLMTQYFDMLKSISKTNPGTLFLPHGPHSIRSLRSDLASCFTGGK